MSDARAEVVVFRHGLSGKSPRLVVGASLALFFATCGLVVEKGTAWTVLPVACGAAVLLYCYLAYITLEIGGTGFTHRDLSGIHRFDFVQIEDVMFESVAVGDGYAPVFSVHLRGGIERVRIPIGRFPIRASVILFTALERQGIPIRRDGTQFVENTMRQVREEQARLLLAKENGPQSTLAR